MSDKEHITIKQYFVVSPNVRLSKRHTYAVQYWVRQRQGGAIVKMPVIDIGGKLVRIPPEYYTTNQKEIELMKKPITLQEATNPDIVDQDKLIYIESRRTGRRGSFLLSGNEKSRFMITYEPTATDKARTVKASTNYFHENYIITDYTPASTVVKEDSDKETYVDLLEKTLIKMRERQSEISDTISNMYKELDDIEDAIEQIELMVEDFDNE